MYKKIINDLRESYNLKVDEREGREVAPWKIEERAYFLSLLQKARKKSLLEVGAGTGVHGKFFQENGLDVTCVDLSPEMVKRCQEKGLRAYTMDFLNLEFPENSFDAIYALNCLLHVPKKEFGAVLKALRKVLKPDGLFYLGQYGGEDYEGVWPKDHYEPKRFYSFFLREDIEKMISPVFEISYFKDVALDHEKIGHFHSIVLK